MNKWNKMKLFHLNYIFIVEISNFLIEIDKI